MTSAMPNINQYPNIDQSELHSNGSDYALHADLGSFAGEPKPRKVSRAAHWLAGSVSMGEVELTGGVPVTDGAAPNFPGVSYLGRPVDLEGVKHLTGHDNIHALHQHLFGDMAPHVTGQYQLFSHPANDGRHLLRFRGNIQNDAGKDIGSITRDFHGDHTGNGARPRTMENVMLEMRRGEQGHGVASRIYGAQEKYARDAGIKEITTHADIHTGPYAWARQGFDFAPNQRFGYDAGAPWALGDTPIHHYQAALKSQVETQGRDGDLSAADTAYHLARIPALQHSWDIANFDTGVHVPISSLDDKPGHLGKLVMTQEPDRMDYNAVKTITPDASSPGEQQAARQRGITGQAKTP